MLCEMPVVNLPDELSEQLNGSQTGTIDNRQGPGVAAYVSSDGTVRADIYIGLKLDGFTRYRNLSAVDPRIKMQFSLQPIISCRADDVGFNPNKDKVIVIKVNLLRR